MLRQILAIILVATGLLFASLSLASSHKNGAQKELYLSYEQRLALTYAMMAHGEKPEVQREYLDRAEKYFTAVSSLPVKTVQVANFEEFLRHFRGQWPDTQSVVLDLAMIEKDGPRAIAIYESSSPRVQRQIEAYQEWQLEQLKAMAESDKTAQSYLQSKELVGNALHLLQDPSGKTLAKEWLLEQNENLFKKHMQEFDRIGEKIANSEMAQSTDVSMKIVLQTMLTEYFARLSPQSKKLIVSSFLGGNLHANDMQKFEIMVQNSGPQLQKLLQIVARQGDLNPEMIKVFKSLEDAVRPVPYRQVEEILANEKANYKFIYFENKPIGVGTMAQVHRAKILVEGVRKDVVVRFIKPDIEKRVEEDGRILKEVAAILDSNPEFAKTGAPKLAPIVADVTATVTAELSQEDTIARQKMAASRYNQTTFMKTPEYKNSIEFHVPGIYAPETPKSKLMVQELVIGKKLDKEAAAWAELAPNLKKGVVEALAKMWGQEVLFGGGFYHSDLHQGNFMVRLTDEKVRVNILDFGMGGVIPADLQRQVMVLGAGIELKNPELVARSFWKISNKSVNEVTEQQLKSLVVARMKAGITNPDEISIDGWTKWAMNHGLRLPYDFISLNRGIVIVNKLLQDSGSKFSISNMIKSFAFQNPMLVYRRLVLEEKLSHADLMKLGLQEIIGMVRSPEALTSPKMPATFRCEAVLL
ncbi:AarF/UbiB family protein [Bdellovibrio svalbardensis]|uniref:AarF/UbiB family protein n=1 Tax=Bdellovibrio svalbardensis TaxID=2972972 RepID=A0ABT6DIZ9_9BACT|nr:AarF/UbiB family protein [Bdellovibrio svalbardensis]MDG0816200.1 AarF/UbiB family protein [Bdellovibrio svalbardensis]